MRKQFRRLFTLALIVLVGGVGFLVGRSMWHQHRLDLLQKGLDVLPGVAQHIRDFRRVKVQGGRKVWEVAAKDARYFDEDKTVVISEAVMKWYQEDGREIGLRGDEGRIVLDGREVRRVELKGHIEVDLADYVVTTERAVYEHEENRISAPGRVIVSGEALELSGIGMDVDVKEQRLYLRQQVSMQLRPALLSETAADVSL
jgi:LPS export ABC transporter protein LptC